MFLLFLVRPPIPEIDLVFALSAASVFHNETFKLMKNTISYIIETYGTENIYYSVVVYGDTATTKINFNQTTPSLEQLKAAVGKLSVGTGTPDLAEALKKALKLFEDGSRRPLTHKVYYYFDQGIEKKEKLDLNQTFIEHKGPQKFLDVLILEAQFARDSNFPKTSRSLATQRSCVRIPWKSPEFSSVYKVTIA